MNKLKKTLLPLLCMMMGLVMLNACEDDTEPQQTIKIALDETSKTLTVGETFTLTATLTPKSDAAKITWSSSDDKIATVKGGEVSAVAEGTATITAKLANGEEATCKVTVMKKEDNEDPTPTPSTLKFKKDEYSVKVGYELDLTEEISDFSYDIKWSTSDDKIATVEEGYVTGVAEGTVTITAQLENGTKATCTVTVSKKEDDGDDPTPTPGELKFKQKEYTLEVDGTLDLMKELSGATGQLLWTSYDEEIATVNGKGVVTGVADGTVTVSVDTEDGNTAECTIVVGSGTGDDDGDDDDDEVSSGTTISFGVPDIDLTEGTTFKLKVIFMPFGSDEPITWSSSNEEIATVEDGVVTAIKEGHTKITARISNGATATIKVIVKKKKEPTVNPLKFKQEKYTVKVGETFNLKQELQGNTHKLLWISYDEDIAYVDERGVVTAKEVGEAEISVDEDPWSASCTIVVIPAEYED